MGRRRKGWQVMGGKVIKGMATACVPVYRELERTHHRREGHRGVPRQIGMGRRLPGKGIWILVCGQWALLMVYRRK